MKKISIFAIAIIVIVAGFFALWQYKKEVPAQIANFEECVAAGNPVMESYPRQCRYNNETFTEDIGNELEKTDIIRINTPRPNQVVSSPLTITGEARGSWFFEASFPVVLTDWDGLIIAQGIATANPPAGGDWMTSEFVPFEATLTFTPDKNAYSYKGTLILHKDNPSGLPEHDDALEIPVVFAEATGNTSPPKACTQEAKLCPDGSYVGRTGPNCEFAPCPSGIEFGKPVTLGIAGTITYTDGLNISVKEINDSRCKADVVCVWQGELSASLSLLHGVFGDVPGEIHLGTVNNKSVSLKGYKFSLESATAESVIITVSMIPSGGGAGG